MAALALLPGSARAGTNADCAALYGPAFVPSSGLVAVDTPATLRPLKGIGQRDPHFGSCVFRATDHVLEPPGDFARNDYSRRQAFNADNSRFIVYASGGGWHLYDADSLGWIRQLAFRGNAEPQWDAYDPRSLYFIPNNGGMTLHWLNVEDNRSAVVADFRGRLPWPDVARVHTRGEGSPSADSHLWCFLAETADGQIRGVFTYDLHTGVVLGTMPLTVRPDHVSMSPSGRYCVIEGVSAWDPTFTHYRIIGDGSHGDLAIGANGNDQFVFANQSGDGYLTATDLETGVRTRLLPTWTDNGGATSMHVSGKAFARPGWVLLSTFNQRGPSNWLSARVLAVELKPNPIIINLAHHHVTWNGYWTEPHATVSRDFSRVLFNSNWGSPSDMDVDAYLVNLAANHLQGMSTPISASAYLSPPPDTGSPFRPPRPSPPPYTPPPSAPPVVQPPVVQPPSTPYVPPSNGGPAGRRDVLDPGDTVRGFTP
jgi:hypothetical protein